jgi:hypothetical protein
MYKCQTTVCGHSFCSKCIDEYLIIKKNCFVCNKTIRTAKGTHLLSCFSIDDVIHQLITKSEDSEIKVQWEKQKFEHTTWQLERKLDKAEVGDKVDVRDTDYIWCVGEVKMIIEAANKEPLLAIHYISWSMYYDEVLPLSSPRIAKLGYYTNRDDIPRYHLQEETEAHQKGLMQAFIKNRINDQIKTSSPDKPLPQGNNLEDVLTSDDKKKSDS